MQTWLLGVKGKSLHICCPELYWEEAVRDTRSETEGGSVWVFTCTELVLVKWDLLEWPGLKTLGIWERKQSAGGEGNLGFLGGHQVIAGWAAVL